MTMPQSLVKVCDLSCSLCGTRSDLTLYKDPADPEGFYGLCSQCLVDNFNFSLPGLPNRDAPDTIG